MRELERLRKIEDEQKRELQNNERKLEKQEKSKLEIKGI